MIMMITNTEEEETLELYLISRLIKIITNQ